MLNNYGLITVPWGVLFTTKHWFDSSDPILTWVFLLKRKSLIQLKTLPQTPISDSFIKMPSFYIMSYVFSVPKKPPKHWNYWFFICLCLSFYVSDRTTGSIVLPLSKATQIICYLACLLQLEGYCFNYHPFLYLESAMYCGLWDCIYLTGVRRHPTSAEKDSPPIVFFCNISDSTNCSSS